MSDLRPSNAAKIRAALTLAAVSAGLLAGSSPAAAAEPAADAFRFAAKITVGTPGAGGHSCTGALVAPRWVVTAKACFSPTELTNGRPEQPTRAVIARPDLSGTAGYTVSVARLRPHADRNVVLARLAVAVTDVVPAKLSATAPVDGETLHVAGYGRTATEWVPDQLHSGRFTVAGAGAAVVDIAGADPDQVGPCKGDAGGPALREVGGTVELVAVTHTAAGQGGCLGSPADAARGGTLTRLDDLGGWFAAETSERTVSTLTIQSSGMCLAVPGASVEQGERAVQWPCTGGVEQDWRIQPRTAATFEIRNDHSGMCLAIGGGSVTNGATALQWPCSSNPDQAWQMTADANGYSEVRNVSSGQCLAIGSGSTTNGATAIQWPCSTSTSQNWKVAARPVGERVVNGNSGLCLSNDRSTSSSAPIVQLACDDANDAEWHLRARTDGYAEIRNDRSGMCLAIGRGATTNGAAAIQWPCNAATRDQSWFVSLNGTTTTLRNHNSGLCLAIGGGSKTPGAAAIQWPCSSGPEQTWRLDRP